VKNFYFLDEKLSSFVLDDVEKILKESSKKEEEKEEKLNFLWDALLKETRTKPEMT
jgi:ElaB/YqjD/DUF883 family membrane-anchored ribosome-binding protein